MQRILTLIMLLVTAVACYAHYTIHSVSGDVKVESAGKTAVATKGMQVKPTDNLVIPQGGKVEILNDLDKRIYTSIKPGKFSVTRLMIDARGVASDNAANVARNMRFGKKEQKGEGNVYVEKGMVRRSLAAYDPEGDGVEMDAATLGHFIAMNILADKVSDEEEAPADVKSGKLSGGGLGFRVENNGTFPIYFNVLKITRDGNITPAISELGQPAGSYVLLPRQSMAREHYPSIPSGEEHLMIMTNCQYDIDRVTEEIEKALADNSLLPLPDTTLPVFIKKM